MFPMHSHMPFILWIALTNTPSIFPWSVIDQNLMTSFKEGEIMPSTIKTVFHKIHPITEWKNNEKLVDAAWDLRQSQEL